MRCGQCTRLGVRLILLASSLAGCSSSSSSSSGFPKTTTWAQTSINTGAARPVFTATNDFDGDGKLDVIAAYLGNGTDTASVIIFFQETPSNFTAVQIASGSTVTGVTSLAIADLDADNHPDVIAACDGRLLYLRSPADPRQGANWTSSTIDNSTGTSIGPWNDVAIGDIDGANGRDIVAVNPSFARWCWFRSPAANVANGAGWTRTDIDNPARAGAASVALADFSGDGRLDVVSTSQDGNVDPRIAWYRNPTNPTVAADWTKFPIGKLPGATRLAVADLDADGLSDVIVVNPAGRQIGWYKRPTDATTAWSGNLLAQFSSATPVDVKTADLDGNGQIDVVVATSTPGMFRWFTPTPGSAQTAQWTENNLIDLSSSRSSRRFALGDIDGDARPDVIAPLQGTDTSQDTVAWLENPE